MPCVQQFRLIGRGFRRQIGEDGIFFAQRTFQVTDKVRIGLRILGRDIFKVHIYTAVSHALNCFYRVCDHLLLQRGIREDCIDQLIGESPVGGEGSEHQEGDHAAVYRCIYQLLVSAAFRRNQRSVGIEAIGKNR